MTRKDYILIAAALLAARPKPDDRIARNQWDHTVTLVAVALGDDNSRFDEARFLKAAGVQS